MSAFWMVTLDLELDPAPAAVTSPVKKNRMVRDEEGDGTECPDWCEIPMIGIMAAFLPTMVLMLQLWQIMGNVNGAANIHAMHSMFYVVFVLFLIVVIESALLLKKRAQFTIGNCF